MSRSSAAILVLSALGLVVLLPSPIRAQAASIPVIDLHVDISYRSLYQGNTFAEGSGEFRASDHRVGGLAGVVLPLFVPTDARPQGRTVAQLEKSYAWVFRSILDTAPYALPGCSIERAGAAPRSVATWLAFEGAGPLPEDVPTLRSWVLRGVRIFGLVHSQHNDLASSSGQPVEPWGLTDRGRRFVRNVYRVGGIIDVSHASDRATSEVLSLAAELGKPVVATHSNARSLAPHPRNLKDEHIRGIARSGGVIGVNFHQTFLNPRTRRASITKVVETISYLATLGGDEVVALGSDFEGGIRPVPKLSTARDYQTLAEALREADFSETQVRAYFSGNARRLLCPGENQDERLVHVMEQPSR